jgi:hypothetical protein
MMMTFFVLMVYMLEGSKIVLFKKTLTIWRGAFYPLIILLSCIFFKVGMTTLS